MADPAKGRATYQDVLAAPEHLVAELIFGELVTHPRPAVRHANVSSNLGGELYGPFRKERVDLEAGSSSMSPSSTCTETCWFLTWQAGDASAYPSCRMV